MCNSHFGKRPIRSLFVMLRLVLPVMSDLLWGRLAQARDSGGASMNLSRRIVGLVTGSVLALLADGAPAQAPLKIFDAHLHYNQEPNPFYDLDKVLEIFRRNNVT